MLRSSHTHKTSFGNTCKPWTGYPSTAALACCLLAKREVAFALPFWISLLKQGLTPVYPSGGSAPATAAKGAFVPLCNPRRGPSCPCDPDEGLSRPYDHSAGVQTPATHDRCFDTGFGERGGS